ncbi:MAG: response regulator transcription factor [Bacteroidaceae bacterium]|nr:response regulator transcription factor [Bacteroidaceae bacterium]
MNLNCVIVDDEPLAQELLKCYVEKTPFLNLVGMYSSAVQAMSEMSDKDDIHLLFLDIQMPGLNGLDFSKLVNVDTKIVFTTAFEQYALDGFKVNALDYLLKPISYADFMSAVNKAVKWFELKLCNQSYDTPLRYIYVKSDYKLVQVDLERILYVEGLKDYVRIHIESEQKVVTSLYSMKKMEEILPSDRFIRVHRSFIVQKNKIKIIERNRIVFDKVYIPISESYKQEWLNFINEHSV